LFNYATEGPGGYVDVDWFRMETRQGPPNLFKASSKIEAEMYDEINGARVGVCRDSTDEKGRRVAGKDQDVMFAADGDWIRFRRIDFGKGRRYCAVRLSSAGGGGALQLYVDDDREHPYATIALPVTGEGGRFSTVTVPVKAIRGVHRLTVKFAGGAGQTADVNWLKFSDNMSF
jgi:hypothetical protein